MRKKGKDIIKNAARELQIPENTLKSSFTITFLSADIVNIEGCRGIIEYSRELIELNLGDISVKFQGQDLEMSSFFELDISISGKFISMEFT